MEEVRKVDRAIGLTRSDSGGDGNCGDDRDLALVGMERADLFRALPHIEAVNKRWGLVMVLGKHAGISPKAFFRLFSDEEIHLSRYDERRAEIEASATIEPYTIYTILTAKQAEERFGQDRVVKILFGNRKRSAV